MTGADENPLQDTQGWNAYWDKKKSTRGLLYDTVAEFYRRAIIRPALNRSIKANFAKGDTILHAGCGSGQVDADIRSYISIIAMDISPVALEIYKRENGPDSTTLLASIFQIPLPDASMTGIYNLGVMEHFTEEEIQRILQEFRRVLRPGGRFVAFWPPEFGLSVLFLKTLTAVLRPLARKDYKFHPDEICRIRSRQHALDIFRKAGFNVRQYYFGPRDAFTQAVIVAEKP
jgi:ubiquinone/menaquinone biosynthesis C-methylase UbiE